MFTLLKMIAKVILFPVAIMAQILSAIINVLAMLSMYIVGPVSLFIIACAIYSAFSQAWLHVGILVGIFIAVQICYFAAAMATNLCQGIYGYWARI